jgi:hypothetical protein
VKVCDKTCIFFFFPIINKYFLMAKRSLLSRCPPYKLQFEHTNCVLIAMWGIRLTLHSGQKVAMQTEVKVKVKVSINTPTKAYWGLHMQIHSCQSAPRPGRSTLAGKNANFPLNRRLCGPHSRSGWFSKEKLLSPAGVRTQNRQLRRVATTVR